MVSLLFFFATIFLLDRSQTETIGAPPAIVIHPPAYSTAVASTTVRLTCAAYGLPTPIIYWSKSSGNISDMILNPESGVSSSSHVLTVNGTKFTVSVLKICDVGPSYTDEYSCWTENGVNGVGIASPSAKFFLSILTPPSDPPTIVVHPPSDVNVDYGSTVEVVCVAYGNPIPSIRWIRSGSNISASENARVYNEIVSYNDVLFRRSVFQLCNVQRMDSDWYSCSASNGINKAGINPNSTSWSWKLSVSLGPIFTQLTHTSGIIYSMTPASTPISNVHCDENRHVETMVIAIEGVFVFIFLVLFIIAIFVILILVHRFKKEGNQYETVDPSVSYKGGEIKGIDENSHSTNNKYVMASATKKATNLLEPLIGGEKSNEFAASTNKR